MVNQNMPQGSCIATIFGESQPEKKAHIPRVCQCRTSKVGQTESKFSGTEDLSASVFMQHRQLRETGLVIKVGIWSSHNYIIRIHFWWRQVIPTPTLQIRKHRPKKTPRWTQGQSQFRAGEKNPGSVVMNSCATLPAPQPPSNTVTTHCPSVFSQLTQLQYLQVKAPRPQQ